MKRARKPFEELPAKHQRGRLAEDAATALFISEGFTILWRNERIGPLEVDLVAQKGDLVVIVEVRTRGEGSYESALASITRTKRVALLRAARALWKGRLSKRKDVARIRIDVVAVRDGETEWIRGAITEQDG